MKKLLVTLLLLLPSIAFLHAEKASFIAEGYNYTRKTDKKILITAPGAEEEFTIPDVATFTLLQAGGAKTPSVSGNKIIWNLDNEIIITNAPGVKINTVKLRYASGTYGQNTQINWGADDRNNDKQFSRDKGKDENGSNIRTQNYVDASRKVRLIAKGEVHLNFIEIEYTPAPTSAIGETEADGDNTPVEYYNLQGIRIPANALVPGIYIRRQGKTATKILIKK